MNSEQGRIFGRVLTQLLIGLGVSATLSASSLFVGFNTLTPVQLYSESGQYLQDVGPAGSFATFPGSGSSYISVAPNASLTGSVVSEYDSSFTPTSSFSVNDLITDGGVDGNNLLLSSYAGTVYQLTSTGSLLNSWSTGYSHVGVTSDGSSIFTTEGDGGNSIDVWNASGASTGKIATPFVGLYGLGYDASTGDFWAGTTNFVYELSSTGSLLATLNLPGDSRTPNGAIHDSIEVGNLIPTPPPVTTPEPASFFLPLTGLFMFGIYQLYKRRARVLTLVLSTLCLGGLSYGSVNVKLSTSVPSGVPVGTTVTLTASASDTASSSATFTYQFSVGPSGGTLQVRRDFYTFNYFPWTPSDSEGVFDLQVVVHSSTGATGIATTSFDVTPRATGATPVINRTSHPLVALYSMPACPAGHTARVRFKLPTDPTWQPTSTKTCDGHTTVNFYLAGMRASSTYQVQQDVYNGPFDTLGPVLSFTTGAIPGGLPIAHYSLLKPSPAPNGTAYPVLLNGPIGFIPYATDTSGQIIWYLVPPPAGFVINTVLRPLPGGTFFVLTSDGSKIVDNRLVREYDLAGNLVREINYASAAAQLQARGADPVTSFTHDAIVLPDGSIALLGTVEKTANQGAGPVDVIGDEVVVVDGTTLQVKWWWNEFDHLDIMRPAVLGEVCHQGSAGCPHLYNPGYTVANDWTHSNALAYTPDGDLLVSSRHQDWIFKVRYANGAGDGALLWRLGSQGDFKVSASAANPWFSHQHNVEVEPNGNLSIFDNGNTRVHFFGGNSRGQAWNVNESSKVATLVTNIDLGAFSLAVGSTQLLSNGNYTFDLGYLAGNNTQVKEYTSAGALEMQQNAPALTYRTFRMRSLYQEY